ncbi:iron complex outermembrane receptor protein [Gillisia sp. Hel_I_86]|uniref:SusC/RagA family TonB-linked outer membrane protein n=1 Tax=Gillisia sp. Hel_I_86 TaxID=1249981 RepID=UPI00119A33C9|nr:SusC/RagA family TonB-linked outer membrane protein [Gillisia sp. Hel_I_86]TVZ25313.1 iron complex outermembrane receptor protein [Gillisia sp. Hel_I_86]
MEKLFKSSLILLFMLPMSFFAQQTVSGTVTESATGLPVPGANIIVKGTTNGTTTDFDGKYTITNLAEGNVLVFSFLGFTTQEVPYNGQASIDITLDESQNALEEVLLIGYGSTTQQDATGAVEKIDPEKFNKGAVISPEQLIAGKSAGVRITPSSEPGGGGEIRIRGGSSLSGNNSPLIVVDGIPLDQRGVQGVRNQLNVINPNEIEDFVILKDAAATSIYGSRASNGVILITTKKGVTKTDFAVEYDLKITGGEITDKVSILNAAQFRNIIESTEGTDPSLLGTSDTDWQDQIYRRAYGAIHNITVGQGYDNFTYRLNFNHTDQQGVLKTDFYERNALNLTLTQNLLDNNLKLTLNSKAILDENSYADTGAIGAAIGFDPTQAVYDPTSPFDGYFEFRGGDTTDDEFRQATRNPLALLQQRDNNAKNKRNITNLNLDYRFSFLPELRFNLNAGFDYAELNGYETRPITSAANNQSIRFDNFYEGINRNTLLDFYFNYKNEIDAIDTKLDLTAGHSYQEFFINSKSRTTQTNALITNPISINRNSLESYFARASFDISNRYLISASYRRDGSSRFSEDNRWSSFPSVSVGWKIMNESFMENSNVFSNLKLRAGYGITGNQEIGPNYGYLGIYTPSQNGAKVQFGNTFISTLRPEEFDENLKWEELKTSNIGLDFGFFDNRVSGSVDAYYRETKDLLATVPVPAGANLSDLLTTNVGETVSRGIEVGLDAAIVRKEDFNWNVNYNISFQDLEITALSLGNDPNFFIPQGGIGGGVGNNIQIWKEGYDPTTFFVYRQVYNEEGNPIEGAYVDVNGDNQITEADRQAYKKATPDYFMGLTNTINYKNLDFSFTFRGNFGNYVYNSTQSGNGFVGAGTVTPQAYYSNLNANVLESNFEASQIFSDYYIRNADFVRLDNVSLGYLFPGEEVDVRASITGSNLFVITDYEGLDPEIGNGIDNNFYPRTRNVVLGLNLSF